MQTGIRIFDHLLEQLARHGIMDIRVAATGDDVHHLVEDVAICLGKALNEALGERRGIVRMAEAFVPMDEALATVALGFKRPGVCCSGFKYQRQRLIRVPGRPDPSFSGNPGCRGTF